MRVACGHDDGLALVQFIPDAVDRDAAHAVQAGDEGVAAGLVRADLLALVKGKQRDAQRVVLRQRPAPADTRPAPSASAPPSAPCS